MADADERLIYKADVGKLHVDPDGSRAAEQVRIARFHAPLPTLSAANFINTLRHWEQGKREPEGPARACLKVIARDPDAVERALMAA